MGVDTRLFRLVGPIVTLVVLFALPAVASAAAPATGQWPAAIAHVPAPGQGCYQASYPASHWHAVSCKVAPAIPFAPPGAAAALLSEPFTVVGDGNDYIATVSGTISRATGSFTQVSPGITETGQIDDKGSQVANEFSLQLNSEFFATSACSGSSDPANCLGWEQFVYATNDNALFMQYWLIRYGAKCPSGWSTYKTDCYRNSPAVAYDHGTPLTAAGLASVRLVGSAKSGGDDAVAMSSGAGTASLVSNSDDVVDLARYWHSTEFNVFGDGGGGQANFGTGTTLDAQTSIVASGSPAAPSCTDTGAAFTAETNNLTLSGTPLLGAEPTPTIESAETDGTPTTASCSTIAGTPPSITNPGLQPASGKPAELASRPITPLKIHAVSTGSAPLTYSAIDLPPGLAIVASTGVIRGTPTRAGTYSVKVTATADGYSAGTTFPWKITVCGHGCAVVKVTNPGKQTKTLHAATRLQIHASDSGDNKLTYSASGLPNGLTINSATGLITGKPTRPGTYNVTVRVTDRTASTSGSARFSWKITR